MVSLSQTSLRMAQGGFAGHFYFAGYSLRVSLKLLPIEPDVETKTRGGFCRSMLRGYAPGTSRFHRHSRTC